MNHPNHLKSKDTDIRKKKTFATNVEGKITILIQNTTTHETKNEAVWEPISQGR